MGRENCVESRAAGGGRVTLYPSSNPGDPGVWRLICPSGSGGAYRWAQLDDYLPLARRRFLWKAPFHLRLRARVSTLDLPGTWGFGLWNDPFSVNFGLPFLKSQAGLGAARWTPALPNTAWFFYGSPQNSLSLRDDLPSNGFFAGAFSSPRLPGALLALSAPFLPLLLWPWAARILRRMARGAIHQDGAPVQADPRQWHYYGLDWTSQGVCFSLDHEIVLNTRLVPQGPLGLVLWIDNQYAAFPPDGRLAYGTLSNPEEAWLEVEGLEVNSSPFNDEGGPPDRI